MVNKKTVIRMTTDGIKLNPFITIEGEPRFYKYIGKMFANWDHIKSIDCRKVNVAKNIMDAWFKYAEENSIPEFQLNMQILLNGPKAVEYLADNYIEIEAGGIEWEE